MAFFNEFLDLITSLEEWKSSGWTIGPDPTRRTIAGHSVAYTIQGGAFAGNDQTLMLNQQQLQAGIYTGIGAQINLILPKSIGPNNSNSFGPECPWVNAADSDGDLHVVLLTGYSANSLIGITWGQRQEISWAFLQSNCWGVVFVQRGPAT